MFSSKSDVRAGPEETRSPAHSTCSPTQPTASSSPRQRRSSSFSAVRVLARYCHPSVCLSVCLSVMLCIVVLRWELCSRSYCCTRLLLQDSGISDPCFTHSSLCLWDMDRTRCWRKAHGSVPYEVPTPNNEDLLAGPYTEHRSRATHRPLPSIGPRHTSPERCLWTHRQALWRHASSPSTPVSRWLISRTPSWSKLEASQPVDRSGPQGQQHTTSWFVEAIHRARSLGGDAMVLADYALMTTTILLHTVGYCHPSVCLSVWLFICLWLWTFCSSGTVDGCKL